MSTRIVTTTLVFATMVLCLPSPASAEPIESLAAPAPSLAPNPGGPASAAPIRNAKKAPQHPFMSANPWGNIHNDTWMTDAYHGRAPLGRNSTAFSGAMPLAICASITFDSRGRINTVCPSRGVAPEVRMIDPDSLEAVSYTHLTLPTNIIRCRSRWSPYH